MFPGLLPRFIILLGEGVGASDSVGAGVRANSSSSEGNTHFVSNSVPDDFVVVFTQMGTEPAGTLEELLVTGHTGVTASQNSPSPRISLVGVCVLLGALVGFHVGPLVGVAVVGTAVGELVGDVVGLDVGDDVGVEVGELVGAAVGESVGLNVGPDVG